MKQKSASEEKSPSENTVNGPGSQLRKARERKGLDQAKVAAQLHLSQSIIQALERDDYDKLPAAVFVQGYLRKYARLLGVDEDATISAYQELHPDAEQQPLPRNQPDEVARELHNDNRLITYVTWGVLLILGLLIFFWWQSRMDSTEGPSVSSGEEQEVIERDFSPVRDSGLTPSREETSAPIPEPRTQEVPAAIDTPLPLAAEEPSPPASDLAPATNEPVEVLPPVEQAPVSAAGATTAGQAPDAGVETEAPQAASAGLVVFEFSGPCWVEVRDATGRARVIGVMRAGTRRSLDAQLGPFRVVIGDIHAVRLNVNGEAYDLRRHTRGKVARFTLDPSRL